jgi:prepilin-type N-terminal cleavage/methylation domain-containing protein
MRARLSDQDAFTIVEVLVAIFIVSIAAMVTFNLMTTATRHAQRAKANQVAVEFAEQELERLRSEPDEKLAMTGIPSPSADTNNPNYRLRTDEFALKREPLGEYGELVRVGGKVEGEGTGQEAGYITEGDVAPAENFESGDVTGKVYRYVVWRNDNACGASCPTQQDYKQIVVAVRVNSTSSDPSQHGYFEVQSRFINPTKNSETDPVKNSQGNYVTAQQFFLTDTPCAGSGETQRIEPTQDHLLHNTLGTSCAIGPKTGSSEAGAPDALSLYPPPDPAPENPEVPSLYDYANDSYLEPSPDTDKGLQIPRSTTTGCNSFEPPSVQHPESLVHRWVTDRMPKPFTLSGKVTFEFYSRTINNGQYSGGLCIYLFTREEGAKSPDKRLKDQLGATEYWLYAPPGYWPLSEAQAPREWKRVRLTMQLSGVPITIPEKARFGLALSVDPAHTNADAIPLMYDFPTMASRLEVDTTTPLEG